MILLITCFFSRAQGIVGEYFERAVDLSDIPLLFRYTFNRYPVRGPGETFVPGGRMLLTPQTLYQ